MSSTTNIPRCENCIKVKITIEKSLIESIEILTGCILSPKIQYNASKEKMMEQAIEDMKISAIKIRSITKEILGVIGA